MLNDSPYPLIPTLSPRERERVSAGCSSADDLTKVIKGWDRSRLFCPPLAFLAASFVCSNVPAMNKPSAEDIVREATAAFNAGQPDEARRLCETGLGGAPGDPMLHHLLAAVLFSQGEARPARSHVEISLEKRPGNDRRAPSSPPASRAPPEISAPRCRIWITPSHSRRSAKPLSRRPGRWTRPVSTSQIWGFRRARRGGRSWR